jgi:hypothetical protein
MENLRLYLGKFKWDVNISREMSTSYEALVLTDSNQNILWINGGFEIMTEYSASFAGG